YNKKTTLIETGSISTLDFPSAILLAEEQISFEPSKLDCKIDSEDRGILDEPSLTLLSNSYRSLTTTTTGQHPTAVIVQSTSQKKKQCSSPLSNYDDKTSACSTPSLSPIKNEPLIMIHSVNRSEISTPLLSSKPPMCQSSPFIPLSSKNSSIQNSLEKPSNETSSDDTSLLSFERHELSAGNATLMTNNGDIDELKLSENLSLNHSVTTVHAVSTNKSKTTADWSYFVTVGQEFLKETQKSSLSSSSSSSSSSSDPGDSHSREHIGGVEYFINGEQQNASTPQLVQLPSLQSALQARRADFVTTSQKRVDEIKAKDYTKITTSSVPVPSRLLTQRASLTTTATITSTNSSKNIVETDSEERQRRTRESKERSKRLYDQLAEVQQKKKIHETKQQAHTYRARMNAFQAALDKKKTNNINNNK
ncbi:unnamed protein product, partial [Rotaria socialis]